MKIKGKKNYYWILNLTLLRRTTKFVSTSMSITVTGENRSSLTKASLGRITYPFVFRQLYAGSVWDTSASKEQSVTQNS